MLQSTNHKPNKKLPASQSDADKQAKRAKRKLFPIVAMGGSAGSFTAFEKFFTHMPVDSGMCFIIIMHLDPNYNGNVAELIQNYTQMPVSQAEDGLAVAANSVYVIPPNKDMGMHNRKLLLLAPASPRGFRLPVDYFFQSIAEDQWNKVVGIIFSGMGSDGETGLRMIKEKLGLTMVQDPETAEYASMPQAAIDTNLVDYVVSPEAMPLKLIQYLNHPVLTDDLNDEGVSETRNVNAIQKILMLLRSHTGHDFSLYKKNTVTRRIDRRIAFNQLPDYNQYVSFLRENPHEIDVLFRELLIGVTKFFRDAAAFDILNEKLVHLLKQKPPGMPIRIWTAGCSTGEETYSIAIILMEYLATLESKKIPKVQIFATDLDIDAIDFARAGLYHENIAADVSEDRLEKYFIKKTDGYSVRKELREMIVFAQHNIIKDAPFTRLDMICCRNVLIYLTTELQRKIVPVFHYSLNPKGIYFMGPAETLGGFTEIFSSVDSRWKIFERKKALSTVDKMVNFPFNISRHPLSIFRAELNDKTPRKKTLAEAFNQLMIERHTPASVLVNDKGDIVYINGKTSPFLRLNPGQAAMNINRMAHEDLKYALGNAIHLVRAKTKTVTINGIKLNDENSTRLMNLHVDLLENSILQGLILVIFEDKGLVDVQKGPEGQNRYSPEAGELAKELLFTKEQLHTTIERMEISLEELKATNEELQITNEESLTTKEEMQSLNEELMTVNVQYQALSVIDITERRNAELKQYETRERLEMALEASATGAWEINLHTMEVNFDEFCSRIFGLHDGSLDELNTFLNIIHPADRKQADKCLADAITRGNNLDIEFRIIRPDNTIRFVGARGHVVPVDKDENQCFIGLLTDITEKKQLAREALHHKNNQQKAIHEATLQAQENERLRISEALHDSVSQLLYGIKLKLDHNKDVKAAFGSTLKDLNDMLDVAIKETRNISFELAPSVLKDFGLQATIEEMSKRLRTQNLDIRTKTEVDPRLPLNIQTNLFRIAQELTNNSIKHAEATEIIIEVIQNRKSIKLTVTDNGKGFLIPDKKEIVGTGLASIKNRLSLYNGKMKIESKPMTGTQVIMLLKI